MMTNPDRILIVDDEMLFLTSMADLLRREGYECDIAADSDTALELLQHNNYDLLISDINMPGNLNLEFVEQLPQVANELPVILITGYPSIESAIQAVQLPIVAYLLKPPNFDRLLNEVRKGIHKGQLYRSVSHTRQRLQNWSSDLSNLEQSIKLTDQTVHGVPVEAFLALTMQNIAGSLEDIRQLTEGLTRASNEQKYACQLLNCQRARVLTDTLLETIEVLENTKSAFKSKELGNLRKKLETVVSDWGSV